MTDAFVLGGYALRPASAEGRVDPVPATGRANGKWSSKDKSAVRAENLPRHRRPAVGR